MERNHALDIRGTGESGRMTREQFRLLLDLYGSDSNHRWTVKHDCRYIRIDIKQSWFWTDEWQAGEAEADQDYQEGRFEVFDNVDDLLKGLDENL